MFKRFRRKTKDTVAETKEASEEAVEKIEISKEEFEETKDEADDFVEEAKEVFEDAKQEIEETKDDANFLAFPEWMMEHLLCCLKGEETTKMGLVSDVGAEVPRELIEV
jgi:vacuolar-type H+-ATPase subunit H